MSDIKEFRLGELFCGPGGLAYGAMNAKIEDSSYRIVHQWANDYDASTCRTYARNICPDNPESVICEDVHFLDIEGLRIVVCKLNAEDIESIAWMIVSRLSKAHHVNIMAMEMTGNARVNADKLWISYRESFRYVKPAIDILINSGIDVGLYNYPLCTVDPQYRMLCAKSISSWKVRFANVCDSCALRTSCGGIFSGSYKFESGELEAIVV